jgi:hypothetical protein
MVIIPMRRTITITILHPKIRMTLFNYALKAIKMQFPE